MSHPAYDVDRRTHARQREIFDEAYPRIVPFFAQPRTWGGSELTVLASHMLREAYPELSLQDVHLLINAARQVYLTRRAGAARGQAVPA